MSIKSANKARAPELLLPPATAETAPLVPIMSTMSSGLMSLSTTSTFSSPSSSSSCIGAAATVSTAAAPMQNVLVYVGNDNYAHAYTVHTPPPPHNTSAPTTYQLQQQQQQHLQSSVTGCCGTAKTQSFYPSGTTYLQNINGYKPLTAADQNLVRYLVSTTDAATDNTNSYVTVVGNNNNSQIILNRCDSIKSESPCSSLSSSEDQLAVPPNPNEHQQSLMGFDNNRSNNNGNGSNTNIGVTVTSGGRVVPVHATVAPPLQAQLPPGTVAGIGGNIIPGTVTVSVPVTAASVPSALNGNFVTIPYGWKRLISNDVIIYVSPSNIVLTSAEQVKDYLQTAGTCKCGLECPFHYESTFNFDLKVIGKSSLLTPDINVDLTKLCNHKRKLQTSASPDAKTVDPMNNFQKDYGGLKKKPKANSKKLVKATTATTTMPPYNSAVTTTAATTTTAVANNNAAILHPLDKNLCSIMNHAVGGPEFAQQQQSQQHWPNQFVMHPSTTQKLPSTSQPMFNNMIDPLSYYRYAQQSAIGQQQHQILAPQAAELMHRYPPPQQQGQLPSVCFMTAATTNTNAGGDLTSLQIPGLTTTNANTHPCVVPQMPGQNQMVPSAVRNGNYLLSGQPTVEQSGPGRPPIPNNLPHLTAQPNNLRLPHPVCYDSTASKQQQTSGTRLPVPYPNAVQHINGMRLLPKQQWNNGAVVGGVMRCPPPPPHQQHNGNIFDRVPPLPQHLTAASVPPVWPEEVPTGRKKPASKSNPSRVQKKQRPNYYLLADPQQQQPCPNVDVRQMSGQSNQQQQHNLVQQHSFNSSISSTEGNGTNSMLATASPSFIDDPSGYLAQQTALLNSTISGQGLQMNGYPCNTPPPLFQPDSLRTTASTTTPSEASKQPPPYQHHRSTNKQQQQHFSGGQVFVTQQQALQLQQQQQQLQQVVVNRGAVTSDSRQNELESDQRQLQGRCTDCLISGQDQQQQVVANKRNYSRSGRGDSGSIGINEDPVTSSTFFDHVPHNTPTCSSTSSSKTTNSTMSSNHGSRPLSRQLPPPSPSVSSPDSRPIQGGTISTSNVSPHHDTSSNSSTGSTVANATGIASPPQQQHQQIVVSKVATSQQNVPNINGTTPRICMTTMASNMATIASGVRTLQTQALPIITSPITLTTRPGAAQLQQQFHLAPSPQQHHQQLVALATAATSANNVCNGTTAVVVSSGANGTLVAKSPLEMVQSVVIKSSPPNYHQPHTQHTTNALPPGHILVSSGGQLLMASTSAPVSTAQQQQTNQMAQQHHLMAPPPPKHQQQLAMPPISVSPMVTNVTASVTQVIPTVAQQVLGQQTVLVNALPTPSFLLQSGVTMTMDGLANLQQIPHLLTANSLLQHHQPNHATAAAALLSPTQDILSALAKNNNGATSPGSAVVSSANGKKGKKRKSGGGQVSTSTPNGAVTSVPGGLVAQPVTNMLHIAAAAGNGAAGVVSPQNFAPHLQMHSPQTSMMQALTIVPGKGGGPPQLVMNASPAQTATQHINLLQPVNLLNNTTGVHIQNYPTIQQFILPNLGGMVVNADGTATILPATATSPAQATADASHHTHAQPVQMQLQLQNVNGQNVLTPVPHPGSHITFSSPPTNNPSGLSMLIRPAITKQPSHHASPVLQHSPSTTAQFLSPNGSATGATGTAQQFVVNGTTFTSGQLSPLITAAGISPRAANAANTGDYGQATLMVPCTPVSSNGGNTYVHQNTTIVQQQTTMVTNNGQSQPVPRAGHTHNISLRPAPSQHTTTLNVNLNEQNQFIISDKSLILQTQAQAQAQLQQQQQQHIQQQLQQARQQLNINQTVNLNLISHAAAAAAAQQYRQSASTQTTTGLQQVPTSVTTSNTFCQTSNAIASSLSSANIVTGGTPQASTTPPTPGSPPDTTTLSPLAPQPNNHIPSSDHVAGQVMGCSGTTIVVASPMGNGGHYNSNSLCIGGGQSPMAGADTTTYSMGSGHSTDDGLSPAPSNCSSVGAGSSGSYAVTSGSSTTQLMVDNALSIVNRGNSANSGQQQGSMAMVHCVSSSEPDATEFTLIDQLDWTKNSFSLPNQNQYNQRSTKKNQKNMIASTPYTENATIKYDMENKPSDGRRTYSNSNLSKSSIDLFQYGNQQQLNQRQTTTLNYPESASTVQYVTGNNSNDATETIIVQSNYNDNPHRNIQQRPYNCNNQTSTVVLDHIGGSYANNIVEELLKQQQLEALQPNHQPQKMQLQQQDHLVNNTRSRYEKLHQQQQQRRKLQKQQQINNIRQTIAALFDDDDDTTNEVSTTKDTIQSAIDSVLSEESAQLEDTEPNTKVDSIPVRSFAVGDLVWAPAYGCPAWPGQVIATANQDTNTDIQLAAGHVLIRWFGDSGTATTSSVAADTLCTLTQGLELHHLSRKRARTSRKLNSQLEKAIQEAMIELDKMSDSAGEKSIAKLSVVDLSQEKKPTENLKKGVNKVGANKDMTIVKKSSSRLRSQR